MKQTSNTITLEKLAQKLSTTIPKLFEVCRLLRIPIFKIDDVFQIEISSDMYLSVYHEIKLYLEWGLDIEDRIIECIYQNQPICVKDIENFFGFDWKTAHRFLTNITFKDDNLWAEYKGKREFLRYGCEEYEK